MPARKLSLDPRVTASSVIPSYLHITSHNAASSLHKFSLFYFRVAAENADERPSLLM